MAYSQKTQIVERNFTTISPVKLDGDFKSVRRAKNVNFFGGCITQRDSLQPLQFVPLRPTRIQFIARPTDNFIVYLDDVDLTKLKGAYNILCRENTTDYLYTFRVVTNTAHYSPMSQIDLGGPSVLSLYQNNALILAGIVFTDWQAVANYYVSAADVDTTQIIHVVGSNDIQEFEIPINKAFPLVSVFKITGSTQELVQPHKIEYRGSSLKIYFHSTTDATFVVALAYPDGIRYASQSDWFLSFAEFFENDTLVEPPVLTVYGLKNNIYEVVLSDVVLTDDGFMNMSLFNEYSAFVFAIKKARIVNRLFVSTYREPVLADNELIGPSLHGWFFYGLLPNENNLIISNICTLDKNLVVLTNQGVYRYEFNNDLIVQNYTLVNETSLVADVFGGENPIVSIDSSSATVVAINKLKDELYSIEFELRGVLTGNVNKLIGLPLKFDDRSCVIYEASYSNNILRVKAVINEDILRILPNQVYRLSAVFGKIYITPNLVSINDILVSDNIEFKVIQKDTDGVFVVGETSIFSFGANVDIIRNKYLEMPIISQVVDVDGECRILGGTYFELENVQITINNFEGFLIKDRIHEYFKEGEHFYFNDLYFSEPLVVEKVYTNKVKFKTNTIKDYNAVKTVRSLKRFFGDKFPVGRSIKNSAVLRYVMYEDLSDIIDGKQPIGVKRDGNFLVPIIKVGSSYQLEELRDIDFVVAAYAQKGFGVITNDRKFDFTDKQGYALRFNKTADITTGMMLSIFTSTGVHCGYYGVTAVDNNDQNATFVTLTPIDEKSSLPTNGYARYAYRLEYYVRVRAVLSSEIIMKHQKINVLADYENSKIVFHLRHHSTYSAYFVDFLRAALNTQNYYLVGTVEPAFNPFFIDVLTDSALVTTDQKTLEVVGDISGEHAYFENARSIFTNFGFTDMLSLDGQFYANILLPHNLKISPVSLNNQISSFSMNVNFGGTQYVFELQNNATHSDVVAQVNNTGAIILTRQGNQDFNLPSGAQEINIYLEYTNNIDAPVFINGIYRATVVNNKTLAINLLSVPQYSNQNLGIYKIYISPQDKVVFPIRARTARGFYVSDPINLIYRLEECFNYVDRINPFVKVFANYDVYNGEALGVFSDKSFNINITSSEQFFINDISADQGTAARTNLNRLHISVKGQYAICLADNAFNSSFLMLSDEPVRLVPFLADSITSSSRTESVVLIIGKSSISAANIRDIMYGRKNLMRVSDLGIETKHQVATGQYLFISSHGDIYFFDKSFRSTKITDRIFDVMAPSCSCAQFNNKTFLYNDNDIMVVEITDRGLSVSNMNVANLYNFSKNLNTIKNLLNRQFYIFDNFICYLSSEQKTDAGFYIKSLIEFHENYFGFYDVFDFYFIDIEYGKKSGDLYLYINKDFADEFEFKAKAKKEFNVKSHTFVYKTKEKVVERFLFDNTAMQSVVPLVVFAGEDLRLRGVSLCVRANNPSR